ncbi:hypothetical protein JCM10213_008661 [Rhodosporidiobolus nylandii]
MSPGEPTVYEKQTTVTGASQAAALLSVLLDRATSTLSKVRQPTALQDVYAGQEWVCFGLVGLGGLLLEWRSQDSPPNLRTETKELQLLLDEVLWRTTVEIDGKLWPAPPREPVTVPGTRVFWAPRYLLDAAPTEHRGTSCFEVYRGSPLVGQEAAVWAHELRTIALSPRESLPPNYPRHFHLHILSPALHFVVLAIKVHEHTADRAHLVERLAGDIFPLHALIVSSEEPAFHYELTKPAVWHVWRNLRLERAAPEWYTSAGAPRILAEAAKLAAELIFREEHLTSELRAMPGAPVSETALQTSMTKSMRRVKSLMSYVYAHMLMKPHSLGKAAAAVSPFTPQSRRF